MSAHGKEAVRLCEHIVRQAFGNAIGSRTLALTIELMPQRVASVLLNRGRLPIPSIARLSGTPRKTVAAALLLLMQHNLVQHDDARAESERAREKSRSPEEEPIALDQFEFDVDECVLRLRWGRELAIARERLGVQAMEIVRMMMVYGRVRVRDVPGMLGAVGGGEGDARRMAEVEDALIELVRHSFLQPTVPELQVSEAASARRMELALRSKKQVALGNKMLSATELTNARNEAAWEVRAQREALKRIDTVLRSTPKMGKKKKGQAEFDYSLRQDATLRINHDRFAVLMRDELIVRAAEDRWNKGAAEVMRAVLDAARDAESDMSNARTLKEVGASEIIQRIPHAKYPVLAAGIFGAMSKPISEIVEQYLRLLSGQDQMIANGWKFLRASTTSMTPTYAVELENISMRLRAEMLSGSVNERLGPKAARVLAVVEKAGQASETIVRDCAMIPIKDARRYLSDLQLLNIIEIQEVPKTAAKIRTGLTAAMEHHLWQVDLPRVYNSLLVGLYKTIANILQRQAEEVERRRVGIEREARTVREGDKDRLGDKDKQDLVDLENMRRMLALGVARAEMTVFVLRDLPGWLRSASS